MCFYYGMNFRLFVVFFVLSPGVFGVPSLGHKMMVTTPSVLSAELAKKIMDKKGNVVDVAVGVALVLAVTNPRHASFGGGGFALVKMGGDPVKALDFREKAPALTHGKYYFDKPKKSSLYGGHAIGVPGIPAGLWALHKKYGKLHWAQLFDIPIRLAKKGHFITGENVKRLETVKDRLNEAGKKYFLDKKGKIFEPGSLFRQKQLAKALKEMRNRGVVPFYEGSISRDIVNTVRKEGGVLSRKDMRSYQVRWLDPVVTDFRGYKIYLMPPPSSGGVIIASSLKILERLGVPELKPLSTLELHYFAEVMKLNFRNRNLLGDPDFNENPVSDFLNDKKNKFLAAQIKPDRTLEIKPIISDRRIGESKETTHLSVLDKKGNAVSMTLTLNSSFGSGVVTKKYGIVLNNEMDDFTTRPGEANFFDLFQGRANRVEPGKRPLSSMSPTLVERNGQMVMSLGAPGGPRIITGVLQSLYRVLVNNYNMEEAIHAPRVHHQFKPDKLYVDYKKLPPLSIEALEKLGHKIERSWGAVVNGVRLNEEGYLEAAFDYRSEGGAGGY